MLLEKLSSAIWQKKKYLLPEILNDDFFMGFSVPVLFLMKIVNKVNVFNIGENIVKQSGTRINQHNIQCAEYDTNF